MYEYTTFFRKNTDENRILEIYEILWENKGTTPLLFKKTLKNLKNGALFNDNLMLRFV